LVKTDQQFLIERLPAVPTQITLGPSGPRSR